MDSEDFKEDLTKCLDMLDENIEILTDVEYDLDEEGEDELVADVGLYELMDMGEDVAKNAKIKKAERDFLRRQSESDS